MPTIIRSPESEIDVTEIATFIARDDLDAALKWIDLIDQKIKTLADFPGIGAARPELSPDLRSFPVGNYLIFYRAQKDGIEIVRILHGARNLRRLFRR